MRPNRRPSWPDGDGLDRQSVDSASTGDIGAVREDRAVDLIRYEASFAELDTHTLYALLKLRSDVFVVEQACPYPELDGRDAEPQTRHMWLAAPGQPSRPCAYLRILNEPDALRIGRVCTAVEARGQGLQARLLAAALQDRPDATYELDAQSYLTGFYERFGFQVNGAEFVEDGIPHTPMIRRPTGTHPRG
jgi:ElaA protein